MTELARFPSVMLLMQFRALLVVLTLALPVFAQTSARVFDDRAKVETWLRENKVPALGVGIIRKGRLTEVRVYGQLQKGRPAPHDAIFNVASLTKPIVAMLTLKLVSQGKWSLDEPLARYWTDPDVAADPRHGKLTTRHVLTHQTGFKNWRDLEESKKLTFHSEPGTQFGYSGEGFEYLARALEKKFGRSLPELAQTLIFDPLRMTDTRFTWSDRVDESRFARWHDAEGNQHKTNYKITTASAADNVLTTIEDYGRFAEWVLAGADLPNALFNDMITPHATIKPGGAMGLGWEILPDLRPGESAILHSGGDDGVQTLVILVPPSKQGLIVMINSDNGVRLYPTLVTELLDLGQEILGRAK